MTAICSGKEGVGHVSHVCRSARVGLEDCQQMKPGIVIGQLSKRVLCQYWPQNMWTLFPQVRNVNMKKRKGSKRGRCGPIAYNNDSRRSRLMEADQCSRSIERQLLPFNLHYVVRTEMSKPGHEKMACKTQHFCWEFHLHWLIDQRLSMTLTLSMAWQFY